MNNTQFNLAPQCKMMTISGIDIIGNPETGTIIGLNENGKLLIQNIKNGNLSFLNDLALVQKRSRICSLKTA